MKALTILRRCRTAEDEIARIAQRIEQRRDAMCYVSPRMDDIGGGGESEVDDRMSAFVVAIDDLERRRETRREAYGVEAALSCAVLDTLPEGVSDVMHRFYVKRQKAQVTALQMGLSEGYVRKLKADGEKLIDKITVTVPAWYAEAYPERR